MLVNTFQYIYSLEYILSSRYFTLDCQLICLLVCLVVRITTCMFANICRRVRVFVCV